MQTLNTNGTSNNGNLNNGNLNTDNLNNGISSDDILRSGTQNDAPFSVRLGDRADALLALPEPAPAPHDLLTRLRDKWGNRLGWSSVFSIPTIEDVPLNETALAPAVAIIAEKIPLRAFTLSHYYDGKLRVAYRRFYRVLDEEITKVASSNAFAVRSNAAILGTQKFLEDVRNSETLVSREALTALEDGLLSEAHTDAATKVAVAGGVYEPGTPSESCVLRHERMPLEVAAARLILPGAHGDHPALLPKWLDWVLTGLIGVLMGLSLGFVTHTLEAGTLSRHLPLVAVLAVVGVAMAAAAKWAVRGTWYRVGQDYYLGCPRSKWGMILAGAMLRSFLILAIDVGMERQGLMGAMNLQMQTDALTGHAAVHSWLNDLVSWVVPMSVTFAYLCCAGDAGYLHGRREEVKNRLLAKQSEDWMDIDTARRAEPAVQTALHALSIVREMVRRRDGLAARIAALAAPFDAKIGKLEEQRLPEREDIGVPARQRVQDARDNFEGAQLTFDMMWEEAIADCEGVGGSWFRRLLHAFGGHRSPRRTRKEKGNRDEK